MILNPNVTLGQLDVETREFNLISEYISNKEKRNRFFKLDVYHGYDPDSHNYYDRDDSIASIKLTSFLKHFDLLEFKKIQGVGTKVIGKISSAVQSYGYELPEEKLKAKSFDSNIKSIGIELENKLIELYTIKDMTFNGDIRDFKYPETIHIYPKSSKDYESVMLKFDYLVKFDGEWKYLASHDDCDMFIKLGLVNIAMERGLDWMIIDALDGEIVRAYEFKNN